MGDRDEPQTPDAIVDHAVVMAKLAGKPMLAEQIQVLDDLIAQRYASMRAAATAYPAESFDLAAWGRAIYVLEALEAFLQLIDSNPEAKDYLVKRLRVIRRDEAEGDQIPVDNRIAQDSA